MTVTISPSDEACQALVNWINSGGDYALAVEVAYGYQLNEDIKSDGHLRVDIIHEDMTQLNESLGADPTSHNLTVWIRKKLSPQFDTEEIAQLNLTTTQIIERIAGDNQAGADLGRVRVWEFETENVETPNNDVLKNMRMYSVAFSMRVEVAA